MISVRRRPERPQHETIVTLIDIVFFLLVFFMLIGRMDATSPFELSPPISGGGEALPQGGMTVSLAQDGRIALDRSCDGLSKSDLDFLYRASDRAGD